MLPGDIVLSIGDDTVQSIDSSQQIINKYQREIALFKIDRAGKSIEKNISILTYGDRQELSPIYKFIAYHLKGCTKAIGTNLHAAGKETRKRTVASSAPMR